MYRKIIKTILDMGTHVSRVGMLREELSQTTRVLEEMEDTLNKKDKRILVLQSSLAEKSRKIEVLEGKLLTAIKTGKTLKNYLRAVLAVLPMLTLVIASTL